MFWWLLLYQAGLVLFGLGYLTVRRLRGRPVGGFRERLALYSAEERRRLAQQKQPVWMHLVSVGEALGAEPLVRALREARPERPWVVTTTTATGRSVAGRLIREGKDQLFYLPWDLRPVAARAVRRIRPALFIAFEAELWPVLLRELAAAGVPVAVVNGRMSEGACRRYLFLRFLMERALMPVQVVLAQSPQDARRFAAVGMAKDRIRIVGNVKWDMDLSGHTAGGRETLRAALGVGREALLWTAGSTHPGEEEKVLRVYRRLKDRVPGLRLLLAPRHPERAGQVEEAVRRAGFVPVRRSRIERDGAGPRGVLLLDTVGELAAVYEASDLVFVGGSLVRHGGHNLVEPAAARRPILTGPHLDNFRAVAETLARSGGAWVVRSEEELEMQLERLALSPALRREAGLRAWSAIQEHRGATRRTADDLLRRWGDRL